MRSGRQGKFPREERSTVSKTPAKTAARPATKKAPAKASAKTIAAKGKPTTKPGTKPTPKPAAKPAAKKPAPVVKAAKPVAKPATKPASPAKPAASKAIAKAITKATPKPAPMPPAAKKSAGSSPAHPSKNPAKPPPVNETSPPKAPAPIKPATRLKSAKAAPVVDHHPPSIPLPPPGRPPASNNVIDLPRPVRKIDPKLANVWKTKSGRDLSDDELQAMPDSEYMNDKQLEFFRARLMQQRNDLLENAGETTEHLREDTSIVPDPADRATIEEEHALELRTRDRERKLLKKISQSIGRIDSGDYGYCDETGEPIGLGRLLARPTATLSLEAQQRRELKQKMFGD
jgi:DnaK suppressor protein